MLNMLRCVKACTNLKFRLAMLYYKILINNIFMSMFIGVLALLLSNNPCPGQKQQKKEIQS